MNNTAKQTHGVSTEALSALKNIINWNPSMATETLYSTTFNFEGHAGLVKENILKDVYFLLKKVVSGLKLRSNVVEGVNVKEGLKFLVEYGFTKDDILTHNWINVDPNTMFGLKKM